MFPNLIGRLLHHSRKVLRAIARRGLVEPSKREWSDYRLERAAITAQTAGVLLRSLLRLWARQCACIISNRLKRECSAVGGSRELLKRWVQGHALFVTVSCAAANFDWKEEQISEETLVRHLSDIELVYELRAATLTCSQCGLRVRLSESTANADTQCQCPSVSTQQDTIEWFPFIEGKDVLVWRQEQSGIHAGLYAYKVYGRYDDVTAQDFTQVQLDTDYRREWDSTAVQLTVVDQDSNTGSEVLYWEMAWPRMFANRDYVFTRRYIVDSSQQRVVILSRSTQHPNCPPRAGLHRVMHYWSVMVIKPFTDIDKPGIEFSLTYFDNPGLSIPAPVAAWVAISGLPDFLQRLRQAARQLKERQAGPNKSGDIPAKFETCGPSTTQQPSQSPQQSAQSSSQPSQSPSQSPQQPVQPPSQSRPTCVSVGWHSDSKLQ